MEDQAKTNQEVAETFEVEGLEGLVEKEKVELFTSHAGLLSWEQWNYLFKTIKRKDDRERSKYPADYSYLPKESVS